MTLLKHLLVAALALISLAPPAWAEICLESKSTGGRVTGELIRFTGQRWDLSTALGRQSFYIDDFFPCAAAGEVRIAAPEPVPDAPTTEPEVASPPTAPIGSEAAPVRTLRIAGSNTVGARLMPRLAEAFLARAQGPAPRAAPTADGRLDITGAGARIEISRRGTSTGFEALARGRAAIAMASRPIRPREEAALATLGHRGLRGPEREHVLALDGIVAIVSDTVGLERLTVDQLAAIFSGRLADWSDLGLPGGAIRVYARDAQSGTFDSLVSLLLGGDADRLAPGARRFESNRGLAEAVAADPRAIGAVAAGALADVRGVRPLALAGPCGIVQRPDLFSIKTEDYALARRVFLYTLRAERTGLLGDLVDFALSDQAQELIGATGFVSSRIETLGGPVDRAVRPAGSERGAAADRMAAELATLVADATRVSVTFRFATGSAVLDNKALQDGPAVARWLNQVAPDAEVLLLGFADARGPFATNQGLSQRRAEQARALLAANGVAPSRMRPLGFSELMPVFCNDTPQGQAKNRRVELWIR